MKVGSNDYTSLSTGTLAGELTEEEQLALARKASMDIALEEQEARVVSFLFYRFG